MTAPLTPAIIAEQLAICNAAPCHFCESGLAVRHSKCRAKDFTQAARAHYRAALEMAARVEELENEVMLLREGEQEFIEGLKASMERSYELSKELQEARQSHAGTKYQVARLTDENAKLREALRFYGVMNEALPVFDRLGAHVHKLVYDTGKVAREALGDCVSDEVVK